MQPHADQLIGGRYRVLAPIGQGGMGTVWLCRDETLHREVAVKQVGLLPGESVTDSARAFREARSSAALSHRNVVTVFDVVEEEGRIWLVMEHVPGRSLADMVTEDGPLPPTTVANVGAQLADGLAAAHDAGTVHRDVKPGNVLVRDDGTAKISDFGIARSVGDPALTQTGFVTGTPNYLSPELARGGDPGPAADVWALGATLYFAVEGRPAYEPRSNPVAVLHDITSGQPARPTRAEFLEPALLRMLDRDPDARWSTHDAADALRRLARGERPTTRTERPAPAPAPPPTSPPTDRRRLAYVVLAVLALLLVLAGVAYAAAHRDDDPSAGAGPSTESPSPSPSRQPSRSPSAETSTPATPTPTGSPEGPADGPAAQEAMLRDYYAIAPGGNDRAWSMLGPGEQAQGRGSYDAFWRTITAVDVADVQATPGSNTVLATLTFHSTDGRTSTERIQFELIRSGGHYLINDDAPAG